MSINQLSPEGQSDQLENSAGVIFLPENPAAAVEQSLETAVATCFADWEKAEAALEAVAATQPEVLPRVCQQIQFEILTGRGHVAKDYELVDRMVYEYLLDLTDQFLIRSRQA